jgi:hypothetical protein
MSHRGVYDGHKVIHGDISLLQCKQSTSKVLYFDNFVSTASNPTMVGTIDGISGTRGLCLRTKSQNVYFHNLVKSSAHFRDELALNLTGKERILQKLLGDIGSSRLVFSDGKGELAGIKAAVFYSLTFSIVVYLHLTERSNIELISVRETLKKIDVFESHKVIFEYLLKLAGPDFRTNYVTGINISS